MINKLSTLSSLFVLVSFSLFSQIGKEHFDNKPFVEGEFLIQLTETGSLRKILEKAPANYALLAMKECSKPMRIWKVKFNPLAVSHREMQRWLYSQNGIALVDYNYYIQMRSTLPGDPSITQQWHHNNTGQTSGTTDADIDSDLAWDITTGGTTATNDDIVLCLIESGNLDHQDLTGNRWFNSAEIPNNSIDDDNNGYVDDYNGWNPIANNDDYGTGGHGTNCLGMMGAKGNNGLNVVGANWNVKLMVVGDYSINTQADAVEAYTYPLVMRQRWNTTNGTEGAFVVATSSSWGIDGADPTNYPIWCNFYDTLGYYGIISVGATTNSNLDVDVAGDMPTACGSAYMLGVGRTDHNDNTAGGYGDQTIEFGAPGINVVTTDGITGITTTTGTSFSCPLTAGVIGLAYSIPCANFMALVKSNPKLGSDLVLQALFDGVDQKTQLATKFVTGGRLNARGTLDALIASTCNGLNICLSPSSVQTSGITETVASVSFTPASDSSVTQFFWREVGAPVYIQIDSVTSPVSLTALSACTEYEFYLTSICGTDSSNATAVSNFRTAGCGNCIDLPYCSSGGTDGIDEWIQSFTFGSFINNSGNNSGYSDFSLTGTIPVQTNLTYNFGVNFGWASAQYDEYARIWIDYNQNGTFETIELVYDQGAASQINPTGTITIPNTAVLGLSKMRVQMAFQGQGQPTLPGICGNFTYGEVEDYCLTITEGSVASASENLLSGLKMYPNPAENELQISSVEAAYTRFDLIDLTGKVIINKPLQIGTTPVDLSTLKAGSYFVRIYDAANVLLHSEKLIKMK